MALQALTGARCIAHTSKHPVPNWSLKIDKFISLTSEVTGEDAYHFMAKLIDVVLPKIREWRGIKGSSGDKNGNITVGLTPEMVALFPEIEINYDS